MPQRITFLVNQLTLFLFLFIGWLAGSRLLYEALFPRWSWLSRPLVVLSLVALLTLAIWHILGQQKTAVFEPIALAPLLLNLVYLNDPTVDLVRSRLLFAASLWLTALLLSRPWLFERRWLGPLLVITAVLPLYLLTVSHAVGRDDTFEFQVVTPNLGIVHPTGYPLYLLLGRPFTALPFSSVAWRLNLASITYATLAALLLYLTLNRWWKRPLFAVLGAAIIGVAPTLWSQAIVAEVYALHALIVSATLLLLQTIGNWGSEEKRPFDRRLFLLLPCLIGLGLTNHLTTVFLIPPALFVLGVWLGQESGRRWFRSPHLRLAPLMALAGLLPLTLYAYLPIRWQAVNKEPMGGQRFIEWVVGGRFQDALQWQAWLRDPTRYEIVGRLFLENWGWWGLGVAIFGLVMLLIRDWHSGTPLLLLWLGYTFYCLNYYVPDLAVFLIPAQIVVGIGVAAGLMTLLTWREWRLEVSDAPLLPLLLAMILLPMLLRTVDTWRQVDQSVDDGRTRWGTAVLNQPLLPNAAILADSDKFPPLYYLQQAEGMRPDLDISVWPDEAAYRAQLDARLATGQPVYLARFLPGLEGVYHLNSAGPLTLVSTVPRTELPQTAVATLLTFDQLQLVGYEIAPEAATTARHAAVTLYWQAPQGSNTVQQVYLRWDGYPASGGQHPANNYYPTVAWEAGEIVTDFHLLPTPLFSEATAVSLQVALAPPFTPAAELSWQTVTDVTIPPTRTLATERPLRAQVGSAWLTGLSVPPQVRPQTPLPVTVTGLGEMSEITFALRAPTPLGQPIQRPLANAPRQPAQALAVEVATEVENGRFALVATHPAGARCGWMRPVTASCDLTGIQVSGVPLPDNATNFADQIALLSIDVEETILQPGGLLSVTLEWQLLAPLTENYTVFVQVLNEQGQIVGQVDSWPVQGTFPTSQWSSGEKVRDPYQVRLNSELPPGDYRLSVGWYLLATLQRLPVLDGDGQPINDQVTVPGLRVP